MAHVKYSPGNDRGKCLAGAGAVAGNDQKWPGPGIGRSKNLAGAVNFVKHFSILITNPMTSNYYKYFTKLYYTHRAFMLHIYKYLYNTHTHHSGHPPLAEEGGRGFWVLWIKGDVSVLKLRGDR